MSNSAGKSDSAVTDDIAVTVMFYGGMLDLSGNTGPVAIEGCRTVRETVDKLGNLLGDKVKETLLGSESCIFLVNGKGIMTTGGLESELKPGDKVEILPYIDAG